MTNDRRAWIVTRGYRFVCTPWKACFDRRVDKGIARNDDQLLSERHRWITNAIDHRIGVSLRRNQGFERGASIDYFSLSIRSCSLAVHRANRFSRYPQGKERGYLSGIFRSSFPRAFFTIRRRTVPLEVFGTFWSHGLAILVPFDLSSPIRSTSFLVFSRSVFELFPLSPRYPRNLIFLLFFVSSSFSPTPFKLCFLANSDRDKADFKSRGIEFPDDAGLRLFLWPRHPERAFN